VPTARLDCAAARRRRQPRRGDGARDGHGVQGRAGRVCRMAAVMGAEPAAPTRS
jgi:hypothetical protein